MTIDPKKLIEILGDMLGDLEVRILGLLKPMQNQIDGHELHIESQVARLDSRCDMLANARTRDRENLTGEISRLCERIAAAEASLDGVDDRIELARVNSELRLEQAHNLIKDASDMRAQAEEILGVFRAEMTAVQREKALFVEERKKAAAERLEHVGPYKAGEKYRRNHVVMRDGSSYICVADETTADPREKLDQPHWRLLAKAGDRGPQGPQGEAGKRGLQGAKGDPGPAGADGAGLRSISTSGMAAVFVTSDGQAHRFDLAKAVEELVERRLKELGK